MTDTSETPAGVSSFVAGPTSGIQGELAVPGDKSITHRAMLLAGLASGTSELTGFLDSTDCGATLTALEAMGVEAERVETSRLMIRGRGLRGLEAPEGVLDLGNSGTGMRLLTGLLAAQPFDSELVGDASLMRRPMDRVAEPLLRMGADVTTSDGRPPVRIRGARQLQGAEHSMTVPSAQVKSAILLAGLYAEGVTTVRERVRTRDHTERLLRAFGCDAHQYGGAIRLTRAEALTPVRLEIPRDISSAAFFVVAAALAPRGELVLRNVCMNPTRTGILDVLRSMGARIEISGRRQLGPEPVADLIVHGSTLRGTTIPESLVPSAIDEFPVIFVAAALAHGETVVHGAGELRIKESDRLAVMATGLRALGARVEEHADGLRIVGGALAGGEVDAQGDHRIAMAFAVAAQRAEGSVRIRDVANVATSFPGFLHAARQIGMSVRPAEVGDEPHR